MDFDVFSVVFGALLGALCTMAFIRILEVWEERQWLQHEKLAQTNHRVSRTRSGRAAQLKRQGVPGGVIGTIARKKQAAPGQKNFH